MTDPKTGESKGFAFVRYCDPQAARTAVQDLDGKNLKVRFVTINQSIVYLPDPFSLGTQNWRSIFKRQPDALHRTHQQRLATGGA